MLTVLFPLGLSANSESALPGVSVRFNGFAVVGASSFISFFANGISRTSPLSLDMALYRRLDKAAPHDVTSAWRSAATNQPHGLTYARAIRPGAAGFFGFGD